MQNRHNLCLVSSFFRAVPKSSTYTSRHGLCLWKLSEKSATFRVLPFVFRSESRRDFLASSDFLVSYRPVTELGTNWRPSLVRKTADLQFCFHPRPEGEVQTHKLIIIGYPGCVLDNWYTITHLAHTILCCRWTLCSVIVYRVYTVHVAWGKPLEKNRELRNQKKNYRYLSDQSCFRIKIFTLKI